MALQQDSEKTFGSTSYFQNKDGERKAVNNIRQEERQKRIATQLLRRNMKKAMRKGEDGGRFVQTANAAGLDVFTRTGLGEEASQAMDRARFTANENFNAASQAKAQLEAGLGNKQNQAAGAIPQQAQAQANAGQTPAMANALPNKTAKPVAPDWAKDVVNDRTFKDVDFTDPSVNAKFQGMTRAEAYDMLRKEQAARFMAGANTSAPLKTNLPAPVAVKDSVAPETRAKLDSIYANPVAFNQALEMDRENAQVFQQSINPFADKVDQAGVSFNAKVQEIEKKAKDNMQRRAETYAYDMSILANDQNAKDKAVVGVREAEANRLLTARNKSIADKAVNERNIAMQQSRVEIENYNRQLAINNFTF
jgi:hypothetical protein